jgi:CO/xanthine dehydrogenase FAD-binding subunit
MRISSNFCAIITLNSWSYPVALWQRYYQPQSIEAAVALLAELDGRARVVAGGTDLLLEMEQGHKPPVEALIDVTGVAGMGEIVLHGRWLELGAAVTHTQIVGSPLVNRHATCLVESCGVIGGPQVRNVATLGGNVAHALPAADGTTALVALDAEAEIATQGDRIWEPILNLFKGPGQSAVDQTRALITRFRFAEAQPGTGTAFQRIMRPQGVALPILACAVWVRLERKSKLQEPVIKEARICLGPVGPVPCRAVETEAALRGQALATALEACLAAARREFKPRTSRHRATAEYRIEMIEVLLRRSLPLAVARAVTGQAVPEGVGL